MSGATRGACVVADTPTLPPVTIGQVTRALLTAMRDYCQWELDLIAVHGMQALYVAPPADEGDHG